MDKNNIMKKLRLLLPIVLAVVTILFTSSCKTPKLESGGPYSPTNSTGQVIYNDIGLALADASYKFAYETTLDVMRFERNNRAAIWAISPDVKRKLDLIRPQVAEIDRRWAAARRDYRLNPTPAGLSVIQTVLAEMQRVLPIVQKQIQPVYTSLTTKPATP